MYKVMRECSRAYAFDPNGLFKRGKDGTYACQNKTYTVVEGNTIQCVRELEDCGSLYVAKDKKACVDLPKRCQVFSWYKAYSNDGTKECITDS